jgi:hypothetical protein
MLDIKPNIADSSTFLLHFAIATRLMQQLA